MTLPRTLVVSKRLFREMRNDKRTIAMIFIAPIFAMFVFGLAFSGEVHDIKLIIVNIDEGQNYSGSNMTISISENIISNLDKEVVDLEYIEDLSKAKNRVKNGKASRIIT